MTHKSDRQLLKRIEELEAQVASQAEQREEQRTSRRGMLRLAGAAAVGGLAAAVTAEPAAAANGDPTLLGVLGNIATLPTGIAVGAAPTVFGLGCYEAGLGALNANLGRPAVFGHAIDMAFTKGVAGHSTVTGGTGVFGLDTGTDGIGVQGSSTDGTGVHGLSTTSIGVHGVCGGGTAGVNGTSVSGHGVAGVGGGGAFLLASTNPTAPPGRGTAFIANTLENDSGGNVWHCYESGTPGKWRKLSGPATAGAFHAITPTRVYDSRAAAPTPGLLATGTNRLVSVADGRDNNGTVTTANLVPAGATAVAGNITVTGTTGGFGYLAINPGGNTVEGASTINWFGAGQTIANGVTLTLNTTRQLTVICNGGGSTHFIIDIAGYYL
jgi:hypothetical protein